MKKLTLPLLAIFGFAACAPQTQSPAKPSDNQIEYAAKRKVAEVMIASEIAQECPKYQLAPDWPSQLQYQLATLGPNVQEPEISSSEYQGFLDEYTARLGYSLADDEASWCGLGDVSVEAAMKEQSNIGKMLISN